VLPEAESAGELPERAVNALREFRTLLDSYRLRFEEHPQHMHETLQSFIDEIGYEAEIEKQYKDAQQQISRSAMLEQFVDAMQEYINSSTDPTLVGYLEVSALTSRDDESDKDEQMSQRAVKLMTLHSAKGLEFPRVYLVGMEEGLLPHQRSVDSTEAAIAEERRLAYVGITRAMDELTLTRAATRRKWGKPRPSIPSRFLWEMRQEFDNDAEGIDEDYDTHLEPLEAHRE